MANFRNGFVSRTADHVPFYSDGLAAKARVCAALLLMTNALGPSCTSKGTLGGVEKLFLT